MEGRVCIVAGQVLWPRDSHFSIELRSYVTPVQRLTGDFITSIEIGQRNRLGTVRYNSCLLFSLAIFRYNSSLFSLCLWEGGNKGRLIKDESQSGEE